MAAGVTQALLDGPLGLPEIEMSVYLARPGVTGHRIRRSLDHLWICQKTPEICV
jgi:hypothetical protein